MSDSSTTLERLRFDTRFMENVVAWEKIPPRPARYGPTPPALDPRLVEVLRRRGISPLYTHQSEAVDAALHGNNVVVVTESFDQNLAGTLSAAVLKAGPSTQATASTPDLSLRYANSPIFADLRAIYEQWFLMQVMKLTEK